MSNFSTAYAALRAAIPTLPGLDARAELANPYQLEANLEGTLRSGWGLLVGDSTADAREFNTTADRCEMAIVLTNQLVGTESNPDALAAAVQTLKDDAVTLFAKLESGGIAFNLPNGAELYTYDSTSGVTIGQAESSRWLSITVRFFLQTRQSLS